MSPRNPCVSLSRDRVRRMSYARFAQAIYARHPEIRDVVTWESFTTMAHREGVRVRVVDLSRPAQLLRVGHRSFIQVNAQQSRAARTEHGMHELVHFWRDDPGVPVYHAEDEWVASSEEDFANHFAWIVCSPSRIFQPGFRPEDFT